MKDKVSALLISTVRKRVQNLERFLPLLQDLLQRSKNYFVIREVAIGKNLIAGAVLAPN